MLEAREENLKKVAWESYLGQNSFKVLNHRGLRSCPLDTLPHAHNPYEFGVPETPGQWDRAEHFWEFTYTAGTKRKSVVSLWMERLKKASRQRQIQLMNSQIIMKLSKKQ